MISLAWPWILVALPLPWLVRRFLPPAPSGTGQALRVPFYASLASLSAAGDSATRRRWTLGPALLVWLLLVLAATRPQWLGDAVELPQSGRDLMLAVDISGSMAIPDLDPNGGRATRLDVVKATGSRFIEQREGDRLGLILFGTQAYLQTPLTFDRKTVAGMLDEAEIGLAGKETAIGDAIGLAIKRLRNVPEGKRVLILLTDGANTAGEVEPKQAARLAAEAGVRIYTIGIGADQMMVPSVFGMRRVNPAADLDEGTLKAIAQETGGAYFRARDLEGLQHIYARLDALEPSVQNSRVFRPITDLYLWPLGLALLLSVGLAARRRAWPRLLPRGITP
jgi:Ca-activated chloride channel family protein